MSYFRKTPTHRGKIGKPLAGGGFWFHTTKGEDKRRRRPELNGPMLPYAMRREAIMKEIERRAEASPWLGGLPVNIKHCIQLKDRSNQKSKDIERMRKEGLVKVVRRNACSRKMVSVVVKA